MFGGGEKRLFGDLGEIDYGTASRQGKVFSGQGGSCATNLMKVVDEEDVLNDMGLGEEY